MRLIAFALALVALPMPALAQLPQPIESQPLRQLDAWSVSAMSRADGALAPDLWSRSDPATLALVFARLPNTYESPGAQMLARRALLSGGDAPRGDALDAARKRFEALGRMGAADELATLGAGAGLSLNDAEIAQFAAQAELGRGRRAEACARGRAANVGERPPPFLLRLRAYCAAVAGDRAAADLALALARSTGAEDAWYTGAIAAAGGAPGPRPPAARYDSSLAAQLSLAANLRPAPNALNNASTLALIALARADNAPQPQRAQAAALAYRRGVLTPTETRALLRSTPAEMTSGLPALVTALRQVEAAPGSLEAGAAIAGVLRASGAPADFTAAARFFKDDIAALQSAPDQAAALLFARAALAAADRPLAQRLIASARQAGVDETALAPLDAAYAALSGDQNAVVVQRRIDRGAAQPRAAARDVVILAALGAPLEGPAQAFLLNNAPQGGARADAGIMAALAAAAERRAVGEGALLAVAAAGEAGPARLDADSLSAIIRALRALGLDADARRIAAEALLAGAPS